MKTFEEFCNSNAMSIILKNHNEGSSKSDDRLMRMAYDEYISSPQLRHLSSYYLSQIIFFPPKLSKEEEKQCKILKIEDCYVDLTLSNVCYKMENYILSKIKRTDTRDDIQIVNSGTYRRNWEPIMLKYVRNMPKESTKNEEDPEIKRQSSSKSTIIDYFGLQKSKRNAVLKKVTNNPIVPLGKRAVYASSDESFETVIERKNLQNNDSYERPGPASKKRNYKEAMVDNSKTKSIKNRPCPASKKPKIHVIEIERDVERHDLSNICDIPNSLNAVPMTTIPNTNVSQTDMDKSSNSVKSKPCPASKKKKIIEMIQKENLVMEKENLGVLTKVRPCPASKKAKYLPKADESISNVDLNHNQFKRDREEEKKLIAMVENIPIKLKEDKPKKSKLWMIKNSRIDMSKGIIVFPSDSEEEGEEAKTNVSIPVSKPVTPVKSPFQPVNTNLVQSPLSSQTKTFKRPAVKYAPKEDEGTEGSESPEVISGLENESPQKITVELSEVSIEDRQNLTENNIEDIPEVEKAFQSGYQDVLNTRILNHPELLEKVKQMLIKKASSRDVVVPLPSEVILCDEMIATQDIKLEPCSNPLEMSQFNSQSVEVVPLPSQPIIEISDDNSLLDSILNETQENDGNTTVIEKATQEQIEPVLEEGIVTENNEDVEMDQLNISGGFPQSISPVLDLQIEAEEEQAQPSTSSVNNLEFHEIAFDTHVKSVITALVSKYTGLTGAYSSYRMSIWICGLMEHYEVTQFVVKPRNLIVGPIPIPADILPKVIDLINSTSPSSPKTGPNTSSTQNASPSDDLFRVRTRSQNVQSPVTKNEPKKRGRKKVFRYDTLPLENHKGERIVREPRRRSQRHNVKLKEKDDPYTRVRFEESSEAPLEYEIENPPDDSLVIEEEKEETVKSHETSVPSNALNSGTLIVEQIKEFMNGLTEQNPQETVGKVFNAFSFNKITKLVYESDDKVQFYSDLCPKCEMNVEFHVDGLRSVKIDVEMSKYMLDMTECQWKSFLTLLEAVDRFRFPLKDDRIIEECCVIKKLLTCLLETLPKVGVNLGGIKENIGIGAMPLFVPKEPAENAVQLDLTGCIDERILGKLEEEVRKTSAK